MPNKPVIALSSSTYGGADSPSEHKSHGQLPHDKRDSRTLELQNSENSFSCSSNADKSSTSSIHTDVSDADMTITTLRTTKLVHVSMLPEGRKNVKDVAEHFDKGRDSASGKNSDIESVNDILFMEFVDSPFLKNAKFGTTKSIWKNFTCYVLFDVPFSLLMLYVVDGCESVDDGVVQWFNYVSTSTFCYCVRFPFCYELFACTVQLKGNACRLRNTFTCIAL